jgi:hypothetical protein
MNLYLSDVHGHANDHGFFSCLISHHRYIFSLFIFNGFIISVERSSTDMTYFGILQTVPSHDDHDD